MRSFKRKRGFITIAQRSGKLNYLRMAYGLALSLKATQRDVPHLSVMVTSGTKIPAKYAAVFDEVIDIPGLDDSKDSRWKIHNKWKVYHVTPYEETILLDADMIFPTDVSDWWDILGDQRDVWFATQPATYRGDPVDIGTYRQEFLTNSLPMVYTAFLYFRQSEIAQELFDTAATVYHNWVAMRDNYQLRKTDEELLSDMQQFRSPLRHSWTHFFQDYPRYVSGDLAFAIATKIMGEVDSFAPDGMFPTFTHMKPGDQGLDLVPSLWSNSLPSVLREDMTLLIGNYRQRYPFHYVEKEWLTQDVILTLEKAARG
jgi:hypothetical protein